MGKEKRGLRATLKKRWRSYLRALHRDLGYLAVGLTFVYAISGLALNHTGGDWDSNFKTVTKTTQIASPLPEDEEALTNLVLSTLGESQENLNASYFDTEEVFEVALAEETVRLNVRTRTITQVSKEPRFFLRAANWLHTLRGKKAWVYIADGYAILLLYLATSGVFMLKGRKGFWGRGVVLIAIGAAVPIAYVQLASGP